MTAFDIGYENGRIGINVNPYNCFIEPENYLEWQKGHAAGLAADKSSEF